MCFNVILVEKHQVEEKIVVLVNYTELHFLKFDCITNFHDYSHIISYDNQFVIELHDKNRCKILLDMSFDHFHQSIATIFKK